MKTILLLEDEPSVMKLLLHMLKDYHVIEATKPEEALLHFIDLDYRVDLLVADLTLPRMSGIQVALHLRSKLPALPLILTSGVPVSGWKEGSAQEFGETANWRRLERFALPGMAGIRIPALNG